MRKKGKNKMHMMEKRETNVDKLKNYHLHNREVTKGTRWSYPLLLEFIFFSFGRETGKGSFVDPSRQ